MPQLFPTSGELGDLLVGFDGLETFRRYLRNVSPSSVICLRPLPDRLLQPQGQAGAAWESPLSLPALAAAVEVGGPLGRLARRARRAKAPRRAPVGRFRQRARPVAGAFLPCAPLGGPSARS